jgi:hypothetical protein
MERTITLTAEEAEDMLMVTQVFAVGHDLTRLVRR